VSGKAKDKLFAEARVFCLPSYAEGFPVAVLDAWSQGLPVLTTPVGGIPDWLEDGANGLLFPAGDVQALSRCLLRLIREPELRSRLGQAGRDLARSHFSLSSINTQISALYEAL
ncbi:MAG: glycosyltransferase family 4 protein, partial [Tannerella sp.]|nr:glycosyltransferase family 4 protein [Tannerella sp.]